MDTDPLHIESCNGLDLQKNETDPNFPSIDIKIKEEEVDLGEDSIEVPDEDNDSLILCPECAYTTHSETLFLRHCRHHQDSNKNVLTCPACEYATTYRGDLNIHTITTHTLHRAPNLKIKSDATEPNLEHTPKFRCGRCEFIATNKRSWCRHFVLNPTHTLRSVFVCGGKCPFETKDRSNLLRHLRQHHSQFYKEILLGAQPRNKQVGALEADDAIYKCSKCKFWGERLLLQAHMVEEHPHIQIVEFSALQKVAALKKIGAARKQ